MPVLTQPSHPCRHPYHSLPILLSPESERLARAADTARPVSFEAQPQPVLASMPKGQLHVLLQLLLPVVPSTSSSPIFMSLRSYSACPVSGLGGGQCLETWLSLLFQCGQNTRSRDNGHRSVSYSRVLRDRVILCDAPERFRRQRGERVEKSLSFGNERVGSLLQRL